MSHSYATQWFTLEMYMYLVGLMYIVDKMSIQSFSSTIGPKQLVESSHRFDNLSVV